MFKPTEEQVRIAEWVTSGTGNGAINAGAGTGKTSTFKYLARDVIGANASIKFMAFNVAIKKVLEQFITEELVPRGHGWKTNAKTFNGAAFKAMMDRFKLKSDALMNNRDEKKYDKLASRWVEKNMSRLDEEQRELAVDLIAKTSHFLRVNTTTAASGSHELVVLIGYDENGAVYAPHNLNNIDLLASVASRYSLFGNLDEYEDEMRALSAVPEILRLGRDMLYDPSDHTWTFTDQVYHTVVDGWRVWGNDWILVDEAQDLSPLSRALVDKHIYNSRVLIVGDPQQAILAFTGADNRGFESSIKYWDIKDEMTLSISWRAPKKVAELARSWKPNFKAAPNAIEGVIEDVTIEDAIERAKAGWAFISRVRAPMIPLWHKFIAAGKPAVIVGSDVSKAIIATIEIVERQKGFKFDELMSRIVEYRDRKVAKMKAKKKGEDEIDSFLDQMASVTSAIEAVDARDMDELKDKIKAIFAKDDSDGDSLQKKIAIMTGHASKGLEFPHVVILTPDLFPFNHPRSTPESSIQEMNLKYVAETRAMQGLYYVRSKVEKKEAPVVKEIAPVAIAELPSPIEVTAIEPIIEFPPYYADVCKILDVFNETDINGASRLQMLGMLIAIRKIATEMKAKVEQP